MGKEFEEGSFEISMYKLLIIAIVGVLISICVGAVFGHKIGVNAGVDSVEITVPEYCTLTHVNAKASVTCNELESVTVEDLCKVLSPSLEKELRVLIVR